MKVHLIKDGDVSNETFTEVFDLLNAIEGPIQFNCDVNSLIDFGEDDFIENVILDQKKFERGRRREGKGGGRRTKWIGGKHMFVGICLLALLV